MNKRVNFILAGKRNLHKTLLNLKKLLLSDDKIIIYTTYENNPFIQCISDVLETDIKEAEDITYYSRFNEVDDEYIKTNISKRIIGIKMPNGLFETISSAYNNVFDLVDRTGIAEYIHCFTDDCIIEQDSAYNPIDYESFMETFEIPFVMDSKVNEANFVFNRYAPRAIFCSTILQYPISLVQFESKDHFIINRQALKEKFNNKLKRLFITEFVFRLIDLGIIKSPSFYPDPVLPQYVFRDKTADGHDDRNILMKEYAEDDAYMRNAIHTKIVQENNISPLIDYYTNIINKLKNKKVGN